MTASTLPILIVAPLGRDAAVIGHALQRADIRSLAYRELAELATHLDDDAGGLLLTEEALTGPDLPALLAWCEAQPPWSDLPVVVLAMRESERRSAAATSILQSLGNVVLLERPINAETLTSAARSTLRARRRQYQGREMLLQRERHARELREMNETLELRVAERARELRQTLARLAFALESAGMGSWDLDLATGRSRRSALHDRIFGYAAPQAEWNADSFLEHVVDDDRTAVLAAFAQSDRDGGLDLQCRIRRVDGAVRWITLKGRVDYDEQSRPVRRAGVVMDVTEQRLTADALHQAQKMEAIGQLTGGVAHDFNNLLTVIVGGLDLILRRPEQTERVVRMAQAAMTAARRGEQLTQQLLAFSRRQMLRPLSLDPIRLLTDFEALAQRAVGGAVALRLDLDPATSPVRVDPAQFEAAVLNLVVNARDAMPRGGEIVVRSRNAESAIAAASLSPGRYVEIAVSDTGTGLDAATLARAFDPFFTTKEVGKGSGLGLSQVYGFVRSAGGDVTIESEVGRGTTVRLYLPQSAEAPDEERPVAVAPYHPASGETVLLVEDDEQVLGMAIESLEELHYAVLVARNAQQALERLHGSERIDILFSDVIMPGLMNGGQLATEARRLRPQLKVLLTSGYVGEFSAQSIGRDVAMLSKPYQRDELAEKLRLVLAGG